MSTPRLTHYWHSKPETADEMDLDRFHAKSWMLDNHWREESGMWTTPYHGVPGLLAVTYVEEGSDG